MFRRAAFSVPPALPCKYSVLPDKTTEDEMMVDEKRAAPAAAARWRPARAVALPPSAAAAPLHASEGSL